MSNNDKFIKEIEDLIKEDQRRGFIRKIIDRFKPSGTKTPKHE